MRLKKLTKDLAITIRGNRDVEINGLSADSRVIAPGNLFIAKKGQTVDGLNFIPDAVAAGAVAVLSDYYDPSLKGVTQLIHPEIPRMEGLLATRYHGEPSKELFTVGITGTNGKTTTAWITRQLLEAAGQPTGMIGTLGYYVGEQVYNATHTTPEVTRVHRMLREMCRNGCRAAVLEATSHALDQGRLREVDFDVALFTNLTLDHLDYHGDFTQYARAKRRLFEGLRAEGTLALCNGDDSYCDEVTGNCPGERILYGTGAHCDLRATDFVLTESETQFSLSYRGKSATVRSPLLGQHNVYNALAAIGVALHRGIPLEKIAEAFSSLQQAPGRMEQLPTNLPYSVVIDFAHTPKALEAATQTLRTVTQGRLITVFGCGGERDTSKRPLMAQAAESNSDLCIVTSDNPRNEDPEEICAQTFAGFAQPQKQQCICDRKEAIAAALQEATAGDTVLIAGRGHEANQLIGHRCIPFHDRTVALELCQTSTAGAT
jgi:UDP-N-acetylmuramoyl-L-alanyl-D-glutamate--2,6-diaminopimelate ligase